MLIKRIIFASTMLIFATTIFNVGSGFCEEVTNQEQSVQVADVVKDKASQEERRVKRKEHHEKMKERHSKMKERREKRREHVKACREHRKAKKEAEAQE